MKYRVLSFLLVLTLFCSCCTLDAHAALGDWSTVGINQHGTDHPQGCTIVTYQLILQNSKALLPKWQLSGVISSVTPAYRDFNSECENQGLFPRGNKNGVNSASLPQVGNAMGISGAGWAYAHDATGVGAIDTQSLGGQAIVVGKVGGKRFDEMTDAEVTSVMKAFYNCGFFCVLGIYYKGSDRASTNGPEGYKANHWAMFVCADDSDVYINDPASGNIKKKMSSCTAYGGVYRIRYIIPVKNAKTSPLSLDGGQQVDYSEDQEKNLENLGVSTKNLSPVDLLSHCSLTEQNLEEILIVGADTDNLGQIDLEQVEGWRTNIELEKNKFGFISILRWIVSGLGIILMIWALFVYLAFWYDHINSFFYIDLLHILTFGKLHICPPNEKPTFSMGKDVKDRTVSHLQICGICITALIFGALLMSGTFYKAVAALVNLIRRLIAGS